MLCSLFFCEFMLSGPPPSHQEYVWQIVIKVSEFTGTPPTSSCPIPNWVLQSFSFLLGISSSHFSFLLNSSKFSRASWFHFLQNCCFKKQNHDLIWNQTWYSAQHLKRKKKKASGSGKKVQKWVWVETAEMRPHCHHFTPAAVEQGILL